MASTVPSNSAVMNRDTAATPLCSTCNSGYRWNLHHFHQRKSYRVLCTSCVLKLNVTAYCPICFSLHQLPRKYPAAPPPPPPPDPRGTLVCFKCKSISHATCVAPNTPKSPYLCPTCLNPNSNPFDFNKSKEIDLNSAKALLAAATIALNSLNEAADQARVDAERRAKEAVFASKRAKEALDRVAIVWSRETERMKMREGDGEEVADELQKEFDSWTAME